MSEEIIKGDVMKGEKSEDEEKKRDKSYERIIGNKGKLKRVLERMIIWGMISLAAATALKERCEGGELVTESVKESTSELAERAKDKYAELIDSANLYLKVIYGENFIPRGKAIRGEVIELDRDKMIEGKNKELEGTAIKDFEKIEIPTELIEQLCESYPENWVDTEIDSIIFKDEVKEMPSEYGIKSSSAATANLKSSGITTVVFYKDAGKMIEQLNEIFAHESGHANDWEADNTLSADEGDNLLLKLTKRYFSGKNIYHSEYVESIKNDDQQQENYLKITEYWAEICMQYFDNPEWFSENHPEDYELVDQWVTKQDPSFDPVEAKLKRENIINKFKEDKGLEDLINRERGIINNFPPKIQQTLSRLLDEYIEKIKETTDPKENYEIRMDYFEKKDEIIESYETNELISSFSREAKIAYEKLERDCLVKMKILVDEKDDYGVELLLIEDLHQEIEKFGEKYDLSQKARALIESIIYNKMIDFLE